MSWRINQTVRDARADALRSSDDGGRLDVEALLGLRGTNQVELLDERARAHVHVGGGSRERSVVARFLPPPGKETLC